MSMPDVVIAGIGQTAVSELWDTSLRELAYAAIKPALDNSGELKPQVLFIGNMLSPMLSHQAHLGALITDFSGMTGIEAYTVEAAGASGGAALRAGFIAIASGQADVALVLGIEKYSDMIGPEVEAILSTSEDGDYEAVQGLTPAAQAGLLMNRYMFEYGVERKSFAGFPLIAHANGVGNPNAMFRKAIREETYSNAGIVCDPLNIFDIAPNADGAAALVLARRDVLPPKYPHRLVRIAGSNLTTDTLALHDRPDLLYLDAVRRSVEGACKKARITPLQVDFFELFDAYSIFAALSLEAAGFAERGKGWQLTQKDTSPAAVSLQGSLPISTLGGLKARGNPGGATGVYQAVEAVMQLRGQAGNNQLADPRRALIQSLGGPASAVATHVLEALD